MDRVTRETLRSFPRAMWLVASGNFVNRFGGFVLPMLTLRLTGLGHTPAEAGAALGAYGVGKLFSAFAGGAWTDRLGHRAVITLSMVSSAAIMLAMAGLTDYRALFVATLALGFASELFRPATAALVAELVPPEQRITAFALNRMAINAGFAFGPALAGIIAHYSFFWVFAGNALAALLYGLIAWIGLPARMPSHAARSTGNESESWLTIVRDRRYMLHLLAAFPVALIFVQPLSSMPLHITDCGVSLSDFGLLLSLNGVMIVALEMSLVGFMRRYRAEHVLMAGYFVMSAGFGLTGLATSFWPLFVTVLVWTFGEMLCSPVQGALFANLAPDHLRGRYMGAVGFMWSLSAIVGPWFGSTLYGYSPALLWWTCVAIGVISSAITLRAMRPVAIEPTAAVQESS